MKIIIEPQMFLNQEFGGITRYYSEIYKRIKDKKECSVEIPLIQSENLHLNEYFITKIPKILKFLIKNNIFRRKVKRYLKRKNIIYIKSKLQENNYDLVIPTYYSPYFLDFIGNKPFVLTIYDMIHELFPHYFEGDNTAENKRKLAYKATKIIAVSQNTKKDILKFYPDLDSSKIEVIYHGFSSSKRFENTLKLPKKYILFVGNRDNYKNFNFFINAVAAILNNDKSLFVFLAGGNKLKEKELNIIERLNIKSQVIQYNFKENELNSIYQNAVCFVFPSEYEGFGIPVLEAMSNGCPIILPYYSSFPEVAGNAGVFYEINNHNQMIEKINLLLNDSLIRDKYIKLGYENVKRFSWDEAAKQCFEVYDKAIIK